MSLKCCLTLSEILIVRVSTPRASISFMALSRVAELVPKQGRVIPSTFEAGRPSFSTAAIETISARVESSPPETPITGRRPVVSSRRERAAICISKSCDTRSRRDVSSSGTKG